MFSRMAARRDQVTSSTLERIATWLSLACAVHCLVVPLAVGVLPLLGSSGLTQIGSGADLILTTLVVASALAGVFWGYRRHRDLRIVFATGAGLFAYLAGHVLESSWFGVALAATGALLLAASSFLSARLTHAHGDSSCAH